MIFEFDKDGILFDPSAVPIGIVDDLTILVPASGAAGLIDGDQFSLDDGSGAVTFEFDRDGVTTAGTQTINIRNPIEILLPAAGGLHQP